MEKTFDITGIEHMPYENSNYTVINFNSTLSILTLTIHQYNYVYNNMSLESISRLSLFEKKINNTTRDEAIRILNLKLLCLGLHLHINQMNLIFQDVHINSVHSKKTVHLIITMKRRKYVIKTIMFTIWFLLTLKF